MIDASSRYSGIATRSIVLPNGREVRVVGRRFLPQPNSLEVSSEVVVQQGERLDQLSARALGRGQDWWLLVDAAAVLRPEDALQTGRVLPVPSANEPSAEDLL